MSFHPELTESTAMHERFADIVAGVQAGKSKPEDAAADLCRSI